jgi:hypothetical protein
LTISNCGNVALSLTQFAAAAGSTVFSVPAAELPATPSTFKPGDKIALDVTYTPTAAHLDSSSVTATFKLADGTALPQSWPLSGSGVSATGGGCSGGSGPVARISAYRNGSTTSFNPQLTTLQPLDIVDLDGSASTGANSPLTYAWQVLSEPPGAVDPLTTISPTRVEIDVRQAGEYTLELTVKDAQACQSSQQILLRVVPVGAIHVELTWAESYGDVDLHYIGPGGAFYQSNPNVGDLDWPYSRATVVGTGRPRPNRNPTPDWGWNNTTAPDGNPADDAYLDVDQRWGNGPENVTHAQPFDGTYKVKVHYYCAGWGENPYDNEGPATATLRVWINGVLQASPPTQTLQAYQVWDAATITVSNNGTQFNVSYSTSTPYDDGWPNGHVSDCRDNYGD